MINKFSFEIYLRLKLHRLLTWLIVQADKLKNWGES